jgi:16S rRNA (cytosine967-C5)-methyltransferase
MNPRATAASAVAAVLRGRSLDDALPAAADPFTRALAYGALRDHARLAHWTGRMVPRAPAPEVHALLVCGLYQLSAMDVAPHAAVNETVAACEALGQPHARGLVNAVLRRFQRERAALERTTLENPALHYSHPAWLLERLSGDWPGRWREVLEENNRQGPLVLRVNRRRTDPDTLRARLQAAGIASEPVAGAADALLLAEARPVSALPGFAEGECSVQDASAQRAADLLQLADGQRVLDACAAPGGKTAHMLERAQIELLALDIDPERLRRVDENLQRLGLRARLHAADALQPGAWRDGGTFDRILLDAPCSGTGVIRRHPDIKWLRRDSDIAPLARRQQALLNALWPLLRPGGLLVYGTCSTLAAEGDAVIRAFLRERPDAAATAIDGVHGEATAHGWRHAPGGAWDGFYYARLRKSTGAAR